MPLLPAKDFAWRQARYALASGLLILFSISLGALGYKWSGCTGWLEACYVAALILTGMGPPPELPATAAAQWFTVFYALYSGLAFVTATAILLTPLVHRMLHVLHLDPDADR